MAALVWVLMVSPGAVAWRSDWGQTRFEFSAQRPKTRISAPMMAVTVPEASSLIALARLSIVEFGDLSCRGIFFHTLGIVLMQTGVKGGVEFCVLSSESSPVVELFSIFQD
jgi:hypothetical protein